MVQLIGSYSTELRTNLTSLSALVSLCLLSLSVSLLLLSLSARLASSLAFRVLLKMVGHVTLATVVHRLPTSVGLAQGHPNELLIIVCQLWKYP